jgi:hypothetical protein
LPVCLVAWLPAFLPTYLPVSRFACLPVYLSYVYLSTCLLICLSAYLPGCLLTCTSASLLVCSSTCPLACPPTCLARHFDSTHNHKPTRASLEKQEPQEGQEGKNQDQDQACKPAVVIDGDAQEAEKADTKEWLLTETRQLIIEVTQLKGYREINFVAFGKILRKFQKCGQHPPLLHKGLEFDKRVRGEPFYQDKLLGTLFHSLRTLARTIKLQKLSDDEDIGLYSLPCSPMVLVILALLSQCRQKQKFEEDDTSLLIVKIVCNRLPPSANRHHRRRLDRLFLDHRRSLPRRSHPSTWPPPIAGPSPSRCPSRGCP